MTVASLQNVPVLQVTDQLGATLQCWRWVNSLLHPLSGLPPECYCMFLWQWLNWIDLNCCFFGRLSLGCQKSLWCREPYEWDFSALWVYCAIWSVPFTKMLCHSFPTCRPDMDAKVGKKSMQQFFHYPLCSSIESVDALCAQQYAKESNTDII